MDKNKKTDKQLKEIMKDIDKITSKIMIDDKELLTALAKR